MRRVFSLVGAKDHPRLVRNCSRGHNIDTMTVLLAGGGVKKGTIVGAKDELGAAVVECAHPIRDLHVTLLKQFGLDDNKLTYFHPAASRNSANSAGK